MPEYLPEPPALIEIDMASLYLEPAEPKEEATPYEAIQMKAEAESRKARIIASQRRHRLTHWQ